MWSDISSIGKYEIFRWKADFLVCVNRKNKKKKHSQHSSFTSFIDKQLKCDLDTFKVFQNFGFGFSIKHFCDLSSYIIVVNQVNFNLLIRLLRCLANNSILSTKKTKNKGKCFTNLYPLFVSFANKVSTISFVPYIVCIEKKENQCTGAIVY